jgi:hypothetical protein
VKSITPNSQTPGSPRRIGEPENPRTGEPENPRTGEPENAAAYRPKSGSRDSSTDHSCPQASQRYCTVTPPSRDVTASGRHRSSEHWGHSTGVAVGESDASAGLEWVDMGSCLSSIETNDRKGVQVPNGLQEGGHRSALRESIHPKPDLEPLQDHSM